MDILSLLFLNSVRGVACNEDGSAWSDRQIAEAIGGDPIANLDSINELIAKGVARRNSSGALFSKRMVTDEKERNDTKLRVRQHRSNDPVTANVTPVLRPCTGDGNATAILKRISEEHISEVYKQYPRKIGRGAAFKSIGAALQRLLRGEDSPGGLFNSMDDAVVYLAQRTRLFAGTPAGQAGEYTPHPATWYNQKRYLDDESEWSRHGTNQQPAQQARQPSATVARWHNNRAERERAFGAAVGGKARIDGDKQAAGLGTGDTRLLDGETK